MSDIVRLDVGGNIFDAELVAGRMRHEGLQVQVLRNDYPETGHVFALGSCALLVLAEDVEYAQSLIEALVSSEES